MIYEALGRAAPAFAHLPMMLAPNGEKLSKRHGAVSVTEYRDQGYSPDAVLNYLARFGWSHGDQEVFTVDELVAAFDWEHAQQERTASSIRRSSSRSTTRHLKTPRLTSDAEYAARTQPFLAARGLDLTNDRIEPVVPLIRERATTFVDAADRLDFVFRDPPALDAAAAAKFLVPPSAPLLRQLAAVLEPVDRGPPPRPRSLPSTRGSRAPGSR